MTNPFQAVKNAIAQAEFKDPDIKAATTNLVDKLSAELAEVGYDELDPGDEVVEATEALETAITNYEERQEKLTVGEVEDQFEGFGEDDDGN
jgi:hypothetical protein